MTATMEPLVETLTEDARWQAFGLAGKAEASARAVMADQGLGEAGFLISLLGCSDTRIADLNADFRGKPQPTNVLSWPSEERGADKDGGAPDRPRPGLQDMPEELGDIAIAFETCQREAAEQGISPHDHVTHLIVHGILHLLGYDHERDQDATLMEGLETSILGKLGIADPYRER